MGKGSVVLQQFILQLGFILSLTLLFLFSIGVASEAFLRWVALPHVWWPDSEVALPRLQIQVFYDDIVPHLNRVMPLFSLTTMSKNANYRFRLATVTQIFLKKETTLARKQGKIETSQLQRRTPSKEA